METTQFEVLDTLQESERFLVQTISYQGLTAVLKRSKTPQMAINLAQEHQAYQLYGEMTSEVGCPFDVAEVLEYNAGSLALSYLEGQPMAEVINEHNYRDNYRLLAGIMAYTDNRVGVSANGSSLTLQVSPHGQSKYFDDMRQVHQKLSTEEAAILSNPLAESIEYYIEHSSLLQTAFVNMDLTASHVMIGDAKPAIFDFENASLFAARFIDLINMTTKIWFVEGDREKALQFYDDFWKAKAESPDNYSEQLRTLIMQRVFGFSYELLTDPNQYHNTKLEMDTKLAANIVAVYEWGMGL